MRTRPALFAKGSTFGGGGISQSEMTEGVRPGSNPLRHGFAVPPLPKGRGFGKGVKFSAYKLTSSNR